MNNVLHDLFLYLRPFNQIPEDCLDMTRVTIIGGGASGTLLAINLIRNSGGERIEIDIIEKRSAVGRGVAYSTAHDYHFLNVPAAKMSAFPDEPNDFLNWLVAEGHNFTGTDFVPRKLFGEYLRSLLRSAMQKNGAFVKLNLLDDEAIDVTPEHRQAIVVLRNGGRVHTDRVVLAFGNALPPHPCVPDLSFIASPKYVRDVWSEEAFSQIGPDDKVLIIGTGLSMVDTAIRLNKGGHRGKITAISTRGILPAAHELGHSYPDFTEELKGKTRITDLLTIVRRHIRIAEAQGSNWRAVIDNLRPVTQELWTALPNAEKRYFMQHLSRYWNAARHRMPPAAATMIEEMRNSGKLEIICGRLKNVVISDAGNFLVTYTQVGHPRSVQTDAILNCIASEANFAKHENPLVNNLLVSGAIRCDGLSLGLDALPNGVITGKNGERSKVIYTLGTALKGVLWETTAIPEIRTQAQRLAIELLSE